MHVYSPGEIVVLALIVGGFAAFAITLFGLSIYDNLAPAPKARRVEHKSVAAKRPEALAH